MVAKRFLIVVLIGLATAVHPQAQTSQTYPPPGRLIDVGGRKLHLNCSGKGSPTVILIAGGGAFSVDWALVQPKVAESARVCSYDRAGLAWSDPGPADETVEQTINDLHTLLRKAKERGPYVLVGASIGGIFIRAYQHAFPNEVAGLVFTNSANRVGKMVKGKGGLLWELTEDELRSAYPLPPTVTKGPMPTREREPFDRLPAELQATRLWLDVRLWDKWDRDKAGPEADLSWRKEFLREFEETEADKNPPLGKLPVTVVSSEPIANDTERRSRNVAAARLDFLSSNTVHITAKGSGHEIHLYQPDVVVQALLRAVMAVRKRALIGLVSPAMPQATKPIVRQIDHVLFVTPGGSALVSLLTDTLRLPRVWPQPGDTWTASSGIGFGNVTLEVFHTPPAEAPRVGRITSLALQPVNLETALKELQSRSVAHNPPPQKVRAPGEPPPRWTTVGLQGFGHGLFLIQYVFDMDERRDRFDRMLREQKGGPLGIIRVNEVVIATEQPDQVRSQWKSLLGPAISAKEDVWISGAGPRIRLVKTGDSRASEFGIEIKSLSQATEALRRLRIPYVTTKHEIRIDPEALFGLRLILMEHR
jgi:pimeloyl-ACP methyl ester carboxylesterase